MQLGAPLLRLEPIADGEDDAADSTDDAVLDLPETPTDVSDTDRAAAERELLRALMLGFDIEPSEGARMADYLALRQAEIDADERRRGAEIELVGVFADLAELSRNRPFGTGTPSPMSSRFTISMRTPTINSAVMPKSGSVILIPVRAQTG